MNGRLVIGSPSEGAEARLITLAMALAAHAQARGMILTSIRRSHDSRSHSCYIGLTDRAQRMWIVRVANHRRPLKARWPKPHFDLVSQDGESGLKSACATIDKMIDGDFEWHDAEATHRMPRPRKVKR